MPKDRMTARGRITDLSPLSVRVPPDGLDTQIQMVNEAYTPALDDDVVLLKVDGRWAIAFAYEEA